MLYLISIIFGLVVNVDTQGTIMTPTDAERQLIEDTHNELRRNQNPSAMNMQYMVSF